MVLRLLACNAEHWLSGDLGFSDADVFNVILVSAARCFFSKVVDATGTLPDAVLQEIPDQLRSALTVGREIASHA
jgi:hypothetical protein